MAVEQKRTAREVPFKEFKVDYIGRRISDFASYESVCLEAADGGIVGPIRRDQVVCRCSN